MWRNIRSFRVIVWNFVIIVATVLVGREEFALSPALANTHTNQKEVFLWAFSVKSGAFLMGRQNEVWNRQGAKIRWGKLSALLLLGAIDTQITVKSSDKTYYGWTNKVISTKKCSHTRLVFMHIRNYIINEKLEFKWSLRLKSPARPLNNTNHFLCHHLIQWNRHYNPSKINKIYLSWKSLKNSYFLWPFCRSWFTTSLWHVFKSPKFWHKS